MTANKGRALPALVVDLDGTLTTADTLVESVLNLVRRKPWMILSVAWWLVTCSRSVLKERLALRVELPVSTLPWRQEVIDWLRAERQAGRRIVLATAAHERIARQVALFFGLFDAVLATTRGNNLKGSAKLKAIQTSVGSDFVYVGDSAADLPIWRASRAAVPVGVSMSVREKMGPGIIIEREFPRRPFALGDWVSALRVHQWVKNLLLFVPLFTSFSFGDVSKVGLVVVAFVAFSLAASATYLLNDLWDLDSDRQHMRKRTRPFASGVLSPASGVVVAVALLLAAHMIAWAASTEFAVTLLGYVLLTTFYSWVLKRYVLMDVLALAMLYTYRVIAGALVVNIQVSPWLLAFSVFTFLSLALVKRCAELVTLEGHGKSSTKGRDYRVVDLVVLWPLGVGASLCSVVVFGLYLGTPEARMAYGDAPTMWIVGVGLIYWTSRMWIKTARGKWTMTPSCLP